MTDAAGLRRRIRLLLVTFVAGLVLSGLTAFPLQLEVTILGRLLGIDPTSAPSDSSGLELWIATVGQALGEMNRKYPFLAYGTDWLAFAHLVIAVAFLGPIRDPVRNSWVITFGLIACLGVIPLALIAGAVRGIPFYWRLLDCSFGILGAIPLLLTRIDIRHLEALEQAAGALPGDTR